MKYRPEIDGLRAVAVGPVVLYHYGYAVVGGGFVGVDVFFVISGFLITSIIKADIDRGRFSIVAFYERRVRRIFPALFVMLLVVLAAASILSFPDHTLLTAKSAIATIFFSSNVFFWTQTGYFAPAAEAFPLLHTWSLGVEEQFYIAFPVFLLLIARLRPTLQVATMIIAIAASVILCIWGTANSPSAAFYLAPTRAWELALGALLALGFIPPPRHPLLAEFAGIFGIAAIMASVVWFSAATPFPGAAALLPCMGAFAVIWGSGAGTTIAGRFLGARPVVFVGLISYSLYLWHWPVFVVANQYLGDKTADGAISATLLAIVFAVSAFSWVYVERPFRRRDAVGRAALFFCAAIGAAMVCAASVAVVLHDGLPGRFPPATLALLKGARDFSPQGKECLGRGWTGNGVVERCRIGAARSPPSFVLWGDSHAAAILPAVVVAAEAAGRQGLFVGRNACPPLLGVGTSGQSAPDRSECITQNGQVLAFISRSAEIKTAILIANWPAYLGRRALVHADAASAGHGIEGLMDGLGPVVDGLVAAGKSVVLLTRSPLPGYDVPSVLARAAQFGGEEPQIAAPGPLGIEQEVLRRFDGAPVRVVSLYPPLCAGDTCPPTMGGRPLYTDSNHLSAHAGHTVVGPYLAGVGLLRQ